MFTSRRQSPALLAFFVEVHESFRGSFHRFHGSFNGSYGSVHEKKTEASTKASAKASIEAAFTKASAKPSMEVASTKASTEAFMEVVEASMEAMKASMEAFMSFHQNTDSGRWPHAACKYEYIDPKLIELTSYFSLFFMVWLVLLCSRTRYASISLALP